MMQLPQVDRFVKYLTYHRCILTAKLTKKSEILTSTYNAFLGVATITWCNVFGATKGNLHWSKTIRNITKEIEQDFKNRIYSSTGLNEQEYQKYQRNIKKFRDKYIAHLDLNWQAHIKKVPHFDTALTVAKEYRQWVYDLLRKETSFYQGPSLEKIIKTAEEEVESLATMFSIKQKH